MLWNITGGSLQTQFQWQSRDLRWISWGPTVEIRPSGDGSYGYYFIKQISNIIPFAQVILSVPCIVMFISFFVCLFNCAEKLLFLFLLVIVSWTFSMFTWILNRYLIYLFPRSIHLTWTPLPGSILKVVRNIYSTPRVGFHSWILQQLHSLPI